MRSLVLIAYAVSLCSLNGCVLDDHFHADPCASVYDGDAFIALIREQNELWSWSVAPKNFRAKMPLDPDTVDCTIIHAYLGFRNTPSVQSDSFAISLARTFYDLPRNTSVRKLELKLENSVSGKGSSNAFYVFDRAQIEGITLPKRSQTGTLENPYSVISERPMVISHGHGDTRRGISLTVSLERDQEDVYPIARSIREQYADRVQRDSIKELSIEIQVEKPSCSLCASQTYSFFFLEEFGDM
jgi:hypothetical protein